MAFRIHLDAPNASEIVIDDDRGNTVTSLARVDALVASGHLFEGCAALGVIVDGLLLCYMGLHKANLPPNTDFDRLTMGRVHRLLADNNVYQSNAMRDQVEEFKNLRNALVHHLAGGLTNVDLQRVMSLGRPLALELWRLLCVAAEAFAAANPGAAS